MVKINKWETFWTILETVVIFLVIWDMLIATFKNPNDNVIDALIVFGLWIIFIVNQFPKLKRSS